MSLKRVVSEVGLDGTTVVFCAKDRIAFLGRSGYLFWVDLSERRDLKNIHLSEGETAWVYYAKVNHQVVSFMKSAGENIEDLPKIDSVEV